MPAALVYCSHKNMLIALVFTADLFFTWSYRNMKECTMIDNKIVTYSRLLDELQPMECTADRNVPRKSAEAFDFLAQVGLHSTWEIQASEGGTTSSCLCMALRQFDGPQNKLH